MFLTTHAASDPSIEGTRTLPTLDRRTNSSGCSRQYDTSPRRGWAAPKFAAALILSGWLQSALAQDVATPGQAFGAVFDALHLRSERAPAPDFVEQSRKDPQSLDYRPIQPTDKPKKKKTPAELDALGAELDGAAAQNRRAAAGVKTPDSAQHPRQEAAKGKQKRKLKANAASPDLRPKAD